MAKGSGAVEVNREFSLDGFADGEMLGEVRECLAQVGEELRREDNKGGGKVVVTLTMEKVGDGETATLVMKVGYGVKAVMPSRLGKARLARLAGGVVTTDDGEMDDRKTRSLFEPKVVRSDDGGES